MPPPSPLAIATSSVQRLLKEDVSYRQELVDQEAQVKALGEKIESGQCNEDGNADFMLKQQKTAVEQTKAIFGPLRERITKAVTKLEEQMAECEETGAYAADLDQAKLALAQAKAAQKGGLAS